MKNKNQINKKSEYFIGLEKRKNENIDKVDNIKTSLIFENILGNKE
jgi:hypothetical protein